MAASSTVRSAERALAVLQLLARNGRPMATMAIARACGIPKSSTHHLLNVMRERHFVSYWEDRRAWTLGVAALEIGSAYMRSGPLHLQGRRHLAQLTEQLGDTSHLAVLHGTEVIYVDKQEPAGLGIRLVTEVGSRLPAHLTAVGRAMLARVPAEQLQLIYAAYDFPTRTGSGPRSLIDLRRDLEQVRRDGYALDLGMITPGISCAAAPVLGGDGAPVAAIGISFVGAQKSEAQLHAAAALVRTASEELSAAFAFSGDVGGGTGEVA